MAIADVYNVRMGGGYLGNAWLNSFWYRCLADGAGVGAEQLLNSFQLSVLQPFAEFANTGVTITTLECVNYGDPLDFDVQSPSETEGLREETSDPAPSFLTASMQFNRQGPGSRYSYKRFCGLYELDINGNALTSTAITLLDDLSDGCRSQQVYGDWIFAPVQVKQPAPGTGGLGTNPTVNFTITTTLRVFLGTQNTRKS